MTASLGLAEAQDRFHPRVTFLNTATHGLAPDSATEAVLAAEEERARGHMDAAAFDRPVARSRDAFARVVGVPANRVAVGSQTAQFVGLVASSLPAGATVLVADDDFASLLFPFAVRAERGELTMSSVPLGELIDTIDDLVDLVAVSIVQPADGSVTSLDDLDRAAQASGALTLVDATQAAGWLPIGVDPWTSIYSLPLRLAGDARRLDVSPAWASWAGQAPALELLATVGVDTILEHNLALANRFRRGLGLNGSDSAIVSIDVADEASARLQRAGVVTAIRAGRLRASFHLYNTAADVDRVLDVLVG
ncbi:MAG: aminotransferase class V-fold PLP-dependent enzyme [Acidimicrobiales bacterium]